MDKQEAKQKTVGRCRGKLLPALLLICVLLTVTLGFAFAKYAKSADLDTPQVADAAKFYFTSDLLTEETAERSSDENIHHISYFDFNPATFPITLYNFKDELNVSQVNITGEIQCWVGQDMIATPFTLNADANGDAVTQKITLVEDDGELSVEGLTAKFPDISGDTQIIVRAVAKKPYDQVLTATFQMHWFDDSITLSVSDSAGSNAALVTLETGILGGAGTASRYVTITYPNTLIADVTDTRLTGHNTAAENNQFTVKTTALYGDNKYTFIFYKTDPNTVYTADLFTIAVYNSSGTLLYTK